MLEALIFCEYLAGDMNHFLVYFCITRKNCFEFYYDIEIITLSFIPSLPYGLCRTTRSRDVFYLDEESKNVHLKYLNHAKPSKLFV